MMDSERVESASRASGKVLLEIRNLSVDYYAASGTVHALDDVSISLERGQILGLAGESREGRTPLRLALPRPHAPPAAGPRRHGLDPPRAKSPGEIPLPPLPRFPRQRQE